ncbi:hypothetical protein GCM10017044_19580 [Kordiimonas sediminis]|uniref:Uncharacterized protein n=1 Tax=Kordiimonas sediminis TaxID=1735581 RepID=A0A919AV24_9PROT|nr:hypothetical protein [Kordiimonas sediminis]GHF24902.1 hypothetical protein GCM10017044_19580 [Kordiimonas sediminis]
MTDLQLYDYSEGYEFRFKCGRCGYIWCDHPATLLQHTDMHDRMYLEEVEKRLVCRNCKTRHVQITPMIRRVTHGFVGGLP